MKTKSILLFCILITSSVFSTAQERNESEPKYIILIPDLNDNKTDFIQKAGIALMFHDMKPEAQAIVTISQAEFLMHKGFDVRVVSPAPLSVDPEYHTFDELWFYLDSIATVHPDIVTLDTLGFSHVMHLPIPVLKISDNPQLEEDEPAILYDGMHHAREPVAMECCLKIIGYLVSNYATDPVVAQWVDYSEIFVVPCMNPDGWNYVVDSSLVYPWWRKNLHDNNGNGLFDPYFDGVDLNRNYDFWWEYGDPQPSSETYRGPAPFSEMETMAKRDFILTHKPVMSITYHSYGEIVYYVKYMGYSNSPDWALTYTIANQIAGMIPSLGGTHYFAGAIDGTESQSPNWSYQSTGTLEFLIETADVFIPSGTIGQQVAADNLNGALYLLERAFKGGITGHIKDAETGEPIAATVRIVEIDNELVAPRTSDSLYGRYDRLLLPGTYTVQAFAENTDTVTITNVEVGSDTLAVVDINLLHVVGMDEQAGTGLRNKLIVEAYPNPVSDQVTFSFKLLEDNYVTLTIYNSIGQQVGVLVNEKQTRGTHQVQWNAQGLQAGVYFYHLSPTVNRQPATGKIVVVK
ncbi:MAG: M14 family zinc carboxypeptidase [Bacteroidetes bacterium]|nr:M14 family zinc carboxypeptidase [Bacteroidota bacterium]